MKQNKFTKSARDEKCTFEISGVCNYNTETTVLCHLPDASGTGIMGGKVKDWCAAFGCSNCHDLIDGRTTSMAWATVYQDKDWYMKRALIRTWARWIELGVIKI